MKGQVVVVDDQRSMCELIASGLSKRGFGVSWHTTAQAALQTLDEAEADVLVADVQLEDTNGLDLCEAVVRRWPDLPVVMITAFGSMETAIAAIRVGAYDFINKPIDMRTLTHCIERAVQHRQLRAEVKRLRDSVRRSQPVADMVGQSPAIRRVYSLLERVTDTDASILITGESGTGKELVARALHSQSPRAEGPFVAVNCAAVPANLLESELFGHVRGAFTDAKADRKGLLLEADRGTLFLDEIGEMPLSMQPKLLRALQEHTLRPVGGSQEVSFDTRVVASTNRDLESAVESGEFREDLFYRINVVRLHVPPLRARGNDVLLLAQHFLERVAKRTGKQVVGIASDAAAKLLEYDWPGNVRQLENCIERAVTLTRFDKITAEDLPDRVRDYRSSDMVISSEDPDQMPSLELLERRYIQRVLTVVGGNKTHAARVLGLDRRTLYRKLERYRDEDEG